MNNPVPVDLLLVTTRLSSATGTFELAALGADKGLDVRTWCSGSAEVSAGQTVGTLALEHESALAGRSSESQLIKSQNFTTYKKKKSSLLKRFQILTSKIGIN